MEHLRPRIRGPERCVQPLAACEATRDLDARLEAGARSGNVPPAARRGLVRYLAVRTIDRYLAAADVSRAELQLVGVASLLLAFKHEELLAPKLSDLVDVGAGNKRSEAAPLFRRRFLDARRPVRN